MERKFNNEEWETCLKVLNIIKDDPFNNPDNQKFKTLITSIYKKAKKKIQKEVLENKRTIDHELLKRTTIVSNALEKTSYFSHVESYGKIIHDLQIAQKCYSCEESYTKLHFFYHKLCPACADFNYSYRVKKHDFSKFNVIITGGRVKIGYATVLKFLRSGANVILTTRFPALALEQLKLENDYQIWNERLTIYGLDLRNLIAVNEFIEFCHNTLESIDILINNAAQTIKYPPEYYNSLISRENNLLLNSTNPNLQENKTPILFNQDYLLPTKYKDNVPTNRFGQPIDNREKNSWNSTLSEIKLEELLEVNLINHISPYQLISSLKKLMLKSKNKERFIINVTSTEGQFSYYNKTIFHPHTNMTKAALNMLTKTSSHEFIENSIYMTAVDVGWISTGVNETKREKQFDKLNIPPLDPLDGAMRIVHPIDEVLNGNKSLYGVLIKDYKIVNW